MVGEETLSGGQRAFLHAMRRAVLVTIARRRTAAAGPDLFRSLPGRADPLHPDRRKAEARAGRPIARPRPRHRGRSPGQHPCRSMGRGLDASRVAADRGPRATAGASGYRGRDRGHAHRESDGSHGCRRFRARQGSRRAPRRSTSSTPNTASRRGLSSGSNSNEPSSGASSVWTRSTVDRRVAWLGEEWPGSEQLVDPDLQRVDRRRRHRPRPRPGSVAASDVLDPVRSEWRVRSVDVEIHDHGRVHLVTDGEGRWRTTSGDPVDSLSGCIDVDIRATPFTNTLPIRRLGLMPGESRDVSMAFIDVPALDVRAVDQRYTCLQTSAHGAVYRFEFRRVLGGPVGRSRRPRHRLPRRLAAGRSPRRPRLTAVDRSRPRPICRGREPFRSVAGSGWSSSPGGTRPR